MNPFFPLDPAQAPLIRPHDEIAGCNLPLPQLRDAGLRPGEADPSRWDERRISPPGDDCWLRPNHPR